MERPFSKDLTQLRRLFKPHKNDEFNVSNLEDVLRITGDVFNMARWNGDDFVKVQSNGGAGNATASGTTVPAGTYHIIPFAGMRLGGPDAQQLDAWFELTWKASTIGVSQFTTGSISTATGSPPNQKIGVTRTLFLPSGARLDARISASVTVNNFVVLEYFYLQMPIGEYLAMTPP